MNFRDIISGLFWLAISIFVFIKSLELGFGNFSAPGSGFTFFWSSFILGILSIILIIRSVFKKDESNVLKNLWKDVKWNRAILIIIMISLYALFLDKLGFVLTTFLLLVFLFWMGKMKYWVTILSAIITVVISYIFFHFILQIIFPRGILGW